MAVDVARLRVLVTADTNQAERGLSSFSKNLDRTAKMAGLAGVAITAGITTSTVAMARSVIKSGVAFESAFAGVEKTVDGTEEQLTKLRDGIRQMAKELPASAVEIAAVAEAAGQLGIQTEDILEFTRVMVQLGEATDLTSDQAATALAQFANITQLPTDQYDELGSTIVDLGNKSAATESQIVEMALRIAGAGEQVGLTEAEILSLAATLASVGIEAEAGGSSISRVLTDIDKQVDLSGDKLDTFASVAGMSAQEFASTWQSAPMDALEAFVTGLGQVEEQGGNAFAVLEELDLTDIRVQRSLLAMAGAQDLLTESVETGNTAWEENIALQTEVDKRLDTTASKWELFKNRVTDAQIELFDRIEGRLGDTIDAMSAFMDSAEFDRMLDGLADDIAGITDDIAQFVVSDGPAFAGLFLDAASAGLQLTGTLTTAITKARELGNIVEDNMLLRIIFGASQLPGVDLPGKISDFRTASDELGDIGALTATGLANLDPTGTFGPDIETSISMVQTFEKSLRAVDNILKDPTSPFAWADAIGEITSSSDAATAASDRLYYNHQKFIGSIKADATPTILDAVKGYDYMTGAFERVALEADQARQKTDSFLNSLDHGLILNASFRVSIDDAAAGVSIWQTRLDDAQKALEFLNDQESKGIPLTEEQSKQRDNLTQAVGRYEGALSDDLMPAWVDAVDKEAQFTFGMDDLNQQLKDGVINQEQYNDEVAALAAQTDPAVLSQYNLEQAMKDVFGQIEDLIAKIDALIERYDQIPSEVHTRIVTTMITNEATGSEFGPDSQFSVANTPGYQEILGRATGGVVGRGEITLVGEQGPELAVFPSGTEIIPNSQSMDLLGGIVIPVSLDGRPFIDGIHEIARYVPHSPAETGPFSQEPNWDFVFRGIEESVRSSVEGAEDEMAAFDERMSGFQVWDFLFSNIEDIASGEAKRRLDEAMELLSVQLALAIEQQAPPQVISGFEAAISAAQQQLDRIAEASASQAVQAFADTLASQDAQKRYEEGLEAWWDTTLDSVDSILSQGGLDALRERLTEAQQALSVAEILGAPEDILAQRRQDVAVAKNNLKVAGEIYGIAMREGWIEGIEPITDETLAKLQELVDTTPTLAADLVDDLIGGITTGRIGLEQVTGLLNDESIPALQRLEDQLMADLAEAWLTNADNAAVLAEQLKIIDQLLAEVEAQAIETSNALVFKANAGESEYIPGLGYPQPGGGYGNAPPNYGVPGEDSGYGPQPDGSFNYTTLHSTTVVDGKVLSDSVSHSYTQEHKFTVGMGGV